MQEDVIDSAAEAQATDAAEAKTAPAWKAALNDKIIAPLLLAVDSYPHARDEMNRYTQHARTK